MSKVFLYYRAKSSLLLPDKKTLKLICFGIWLKNSRCTSKYFHQSQEHKGLTTCK